MPALQVTVDQRGGADIGRLVDEGGQVGMRRYLTREVVIDSAYVKEKLEDIMEDENLSRYIL